MRGEAVSRVSNDFSSRSDSSRRPTSPLSLWVAYCPLHLKAGVLPKTEGEQALDDLLDGVLRLGWIEPADEGAEWASPAFLVPTTSKGKWRSVVGYREFCAVCGCLLCL